MQNFTLALPSKEIARIQVTHILMACCCEQYNGLMCV